MDLQRKRKTVEKAKTEMVYAERQLKEKVKKLKSDYGIKSVDGIETKRKTLRKKLKTLSDKKEVVEGKLDKLLEGIEE